MRASSLRYIHLELAGAIATALCLLLLSIEVVSPVWSIGAFVVYIWICTIFIRLQTRGMVLILPLMITSASVVIALSMIEFGFPIPELDTVGSPGAYTISFVLYETVFLLAFASAFALLNGHGSKASPFQMQVRSFYAKYARLIALGILVLAILNILILLAFGAMTGFPLLTGTDRFMYRRMMGNVVILYLLNFKSICAFIIGFGAFVVARDRVIRLALIMCFTLLSFVYFLFGDKFFTILSAVASFLAPWLYLNHVMVRKRLGIFALGAAVLAVPACGITWMIYSNFGQISTYETSQRLSGRIVGQGELWFIQSKVGAKAFQWDSLLVQRNIESLFIKDADLNALRASIGPHYFSDRYAPDKIRASIHRNAGSTTYTMALEPLGLVMFGWAGLVILKALCGGLAALLATYLSWAIRTGSILSAAFASYVFVQLTYFFRQGSPWVFFGIYALRWDFVILMFELAIILLVMSQTAKPTLRRHPQWR